MARLADIIMCKLSNFNSDMQFIMPGNSSCFSAFLNAKIYVV